MATTSHVLTTADPIFAAIEAHRAHWAAFAAVEARTGRWPRFNSKRYAERHAARDLYWRHSDALFDTVATSAGGLLAFAQYVAEFEADQEPPVPVAHVMATIAASLAGIADAEACR